MVIQASSLATLLIRFGPHHVARARKNTEKKLSLPHCQLHRSHLSTLVYVVVFPTPFPVTNNPGKQTFLDIFKLSTVIILQPSEYI